MSIEQFLNAVLPTQGIRFGLANFGQQGDPDFRPAQRDFPVGDTKELMSYCSWGSGSGANAYFAVGGFVTVINPNTGKPQRLASAAQWHRCVRLDIDVGASKAAKGEGYATKRDALVALLSFIAHWQMPTPWIVDSGGGVHVYWSFDRDVTLAEWLPMAGKLRAACEAFGLLTDTTTTTDAARVLRMPGTCNYKPEFVAAGAVPLVRILQDGVSVPPERVVMGLPEAALTYTNTAIPVALRGQVSELQANLHQPYFLRDMLKQCPGLTAMVGNGGSEAPEPLWKATLDLINKSDESDELKLRVARGVSVGHKGFSEEAFRRKWNQVLEQDYHPPTCTRMQGAGMRECAGCPLRGKISSPLVLGRPSATPASDAAVPPLPAPPADPPAGQHQSPPPPGGMALAAAPTPVQVGIFVIDASTVVRVVDGRLTSRLLVADGYPIQIRDTAPDEQGVKRQYNHKMLDYRLLRVERMLDRVGERSVVVLTFDAGKDGLAMIEVDNRDFAEPKSFFNKMNANGLYCTRKAGAEFVDTFMTEFLTQLQRSRAASHISSRCGWSDDFASFVLGTQLYRNDGSSEHIRTAIAPGEMEGYHAAGNYDQWRAAFNIALSGGADRQCVLALAIAGPLMVFTGLDGVLLNAYSPESGVGKSTLCDAALSIWGSPNVLRKDFRDTANATFKLASVMGNMPMVIDEFTNVEGKALSDYVYTITQGREKHRLTSDARINSNGQRWCLAGITTANNSVLDKLQQFRSDATAEAARVFELRLHPLKIDAAEMGAIKDKLSALRHSYGFLGPQLVAMFLSKPPQYWRDAVMSRVSKWDREAATSAGDRFRSATCALIEVGARLGQALGFAFDPAAVESELRRHWTKQVAEFEAERKTPFDFLNGYVVEHLSDFAMIGGVKGDQIINPNAPRRFMGEIRGATAQGAYKPATVMIPIERLREYVRDKNGNFKSVLEWLQVSPVVTRMGKLAYLEHTVQQVTTHAVEFKHADVVGTLKPVLAAVPAVLTNPPQEKQQ